MIDDPAIGDVQGPNLTRGQGSRTANYGTERKALWTFLSQVSAQPTNPG
ncbi:MAG: hypothetical protein WDO69_03220 [Pseudomonadota bacterium]